MEKNELPCGVILVIFLVGIFLTIFLVNYPESSNAWAAWAAWVQGFGSIGAIMAAYFLGERQAKRSEALQNSLAKDVVEQKRAALFAIAQSVQHLADEVDRVFTPNPTWQQVRDYLCDDDVINDYMSALRSVPIHEIGSPVAVREFILLHENLSRIKNCAKHWREIRYNWQTSDESRDEYLTQSNNLMKEVIGAIREQVGRIHIAMYASEEVVPAKAA